MPAAAKPDPSAAPRLKLVIRRLPPTIPEKIFWQSVSEWITPESCTWKRWVQGAKVDENNLHQVFSRAYVLMTSRDQLAAFAQAFDGHGFRSKDGSEYRAVVEYAPSQKVPNQKKARTDNKQGQIDSDPAFLSFLELLNAPMTKPEAPSLSTYVAPQSTALLDHLRELRSSKGKATTSTNTHSPNAPGTPQRRSDHHTRSADDSPGRTPKNAKQAQVQAQRDRTMAEGAARAIAQAQAQGQGQLEGNGPGGREDRKGGEKNGRGGSGQVGSNVGGSGKGSGQNRQLPQPQGPGGQGLGQGQVPTPRGKGKQPPSNHSYQPDPTTQAPANKPAVQIMKRAPPVPTTTNDSSATNSTPLPPKISRAPVSIPAPSQSQSKQSPSDGPRVSPSGNNANQQGRSSQRPKIAPGGLGGKALLSAALHATASQAQSGPSGSNVSGNGNNGRNSRTAGISSVTSSSPTTASTKKGEKDVPGQDGVDGDGERKRVRTRGKKKGGPGGTETETQAGSHAAPSNVPDSW